MKQLKYLTAEQIAHLDKLDQEADTNRMIRVMKHFEANPLKPIKLGERNGTVTAKRDTSVHTISRYTGRGKLLSHASLRPNNKDFKR